ncbi:arylesterase [Orrella sp. JC864]|uniref:arylesterase n=1 Tax=Orrella sp. JC864 TaxID=3120298 RepID=UPI0012BBC111
MIIRLLSCIVLACAPWLAALAQTAAPAQGSAQPPVRILIVGDSLSAEYGLTRGSGWVAILQERLARDYPGAQVANASISGDTTSGGVSRLPAELERVQPDIVILELGSNDALRGLPLDMTEKNLRTMAQAARAAGARVIIAGMQIPPNYGRPYAERFRTLFESVAQAEQAELIPFLLEGMAQDRAMFQDDAIHPTEKAQPVIFENVWRVLEPVVREVGGVKG